MATKAELQAYIAQALPDNSSGAITEAVMRNVLNETTNWVTEYNPAWNYLGAWGAVTYALNDVVQYNGGSYRCKVASTTATPTDTTKWEQVAAKGDSGDQVINFGGSIIKNGAAELGNNSSWDAAVVFVPGGDGLYNSFRITSGTKINTTDIIFNPNRLLRMRAKMKGNGTGYLTGYSFNAANQMIQKTNGAWGATDSGIGLSESTFQLIETYIGGVGTLGINLSSNAVKCRIGVNISASTLCEFSQLTVEYVRLSEAVPSNLTWFPDGQAVYDVVNSKKRGIYINSTVGIFWFTHQEITLQPNGTSVIFNIRRPYKFRWSVVYNDAVTIVSSTHAQNTDVAANTDSFLTLTGTAGKTVTIAIQETI